jgi:hypothetical protein
MFINLFAEMKYLCMRASACGARNNHRACAFLVYFDRGDIIASLYLALRALGVSANCATPRIIQFATNILPRNSIHCQ